MKHRKFNFSNFEEYYKEGKNDTEIANILGCTRVWVGNYRRKLNLPLITHQVSQIQTNVMVGSLLGDMSIYRPKKGGYAGGFTHSIKQKDYFMYKYNLMLNLLGNIYYPVNKRNGKEYLHISTYLKQGVHLEIFYNSFYENGKKCLPNKKFIYENFNDLSLAILIGDDGNFADNTYTIATMCFEFKEILFLQTLLFEKFQIETTVHKNKSIRIRSKDAEKTSNIIKPYLENSLKYKLKNGPV